MVIENEHLEGKVILEVGSGRGDTTRQLADLLSGQPGAQLIVSDISDRFFQQLADDLRARDIEVRFVQTAAHELRGIPENSVDHLVCNYTLCAVNSRDGMVALALKRFREVLRVGGSLLVTEEFPISKQDTPAQAIWAEKWRILKSAMTIVGEPSYNEMAPGTLAGLCRLAGFTDIVWTEHTDAIHDTGALDFFQRRLDVLMRRLPSEKLRADFAEAAEMLHKKMAEVGAMEVPYYRLTAHRPDS